MIKSYNRLNNILGWSIFIIASFIYLSTIEQTVSFWDCGEYISTAYKLEVGHPPGAPLFQLLGRIFTLFANSGTSEVAVAINILSALCSSFTVLFLFWTITAFGRKIYLINNENAEKSKTIAVLGAGVVGALTYAFSDSFWFSAVEGEVYAMSSFFTAITFWCIMKWEREANQPYADRWLILIAYLIGLSVGVHLLSLLTIPAMGMIYYYKKYEYSKGGAIKAFIVSMVLLGIVQGVIIPQTLSLMSTFELFFVNTIGLPFNSGTVIYFILLISVIILGLRYTKTKNKAIWNTAILGFSVILIGYSSFAMLVVRSNANPPIDENNPEDAVGLLSYLKREQYGSWPIIYGHYFNAQLDRKEPYTDGNPIYVKDEKKGKYVIIDKRENTIPNYSSNHKTLFPRMWSNTQARHANGYKSWAGLSKNKKRIPTFSQNLSFFFKYQIGWSYLRYFMWNFVGRQNDYMNMDGNVLHGNWESGISFIDNARLGTPSSIDMPEYLANNKAKNHYYFLPFILGLIGMFFHYKKNKQDAIAVLLFFLFTGVMIIIYLNITPYQPRERDYAYVGSYYAFTIWIGMSVLAIYDFLSKKIPATANAVFSTIIALILAPTLMASENWNDHDRSGRFTAKEVAANYLNSCAKNAILFTNGDNDTFPLWYMQEVEGVRTDIKVVNLSLFNTSWYIDQMKRASYDAAPIPSSFTNSQYRTGTRDYIPIDNKKTGYVDVKKVIDFIGSDNRQTKTVTNMGKKDFCPAKKLKLRVDREKVKSFVPTEYQDKIVDEIKWELKGRGIYKNQLMVLDMLAHNNWERPIYFAITVGTDNFMGLEKYFQLEGLSYRLVPYIANSPDRQTGVVNIDIMYDNLMHKFTWGGLNDPDVYLDETNTRMVMNFRNNFARLAEALYRKNRKDSAIAVIDKCVEEMPKTTAPFSYFSFPLVNTYYLLDANKKGDVILADMIESFLDEFHYLNAIKDKNGIKRNREIAGSVLSNISQLIQRFKLADVSYIYSELKGKYFKEKNETKEEISKNDYLINTFLSEYTNAVKSQSEYN